MSDTNWLGTGDCGDVTASLPRFANGGRIPSSDSDDILEHVSFCNYGIRIADYNGPGRNRILKRINEGITDYENPYRP